MEMSADYNKSSDKTPEEEPLDSEGTLETAITQKPMITCKVCNKKVQRSKIVIHLTRSKKGCKEGYGNLEAMIAQRDKERKEYLKNYDKKYNELNADKRSKTKARKYSENSESINQKRRETYKLKKIAKMKDSDCKLETKKTQPNVNIKIPTGNEKEPKDTDGKIAICKGCKKEIKENVIINHILTSTTCESTYNEKEIHDMLEKERAYKNKYQRDYYKKKGDKKRERQAKYYKENKEAIKEKKKEHYAANRWKIHEIRKKHYDKNSEVIKNKMKKNYDPVAKKKKLESKKNFVCFCGKSSCRGCEASRGEKDDVEYNLWMQNLQKFKYAEVYFNECFKRVEYKLFRTATNQDLEIFDEISELRLRFLQIYGKINADNEATMIKVNRLFLSEDVQRIYKEKKEYISNEWIAPLEETESLFILVSDHLTPKDGYRREPINTPCKDKEHCEKCINVLKYFKENLSGYYTCHTWHAQWKLKDHSTSLGHLDMSEVNATKIEKIKARIEELYTDLERKITKPSVELDDLKWWKEIHLLYGKISVLEGSQHTDDQSFMDVEWKTMFKYVNFVFCTGCKWCRKKSHFDYDVQKRVK